jgi:hypothetical protein
MWLTRRVFGVLGNVVVFTTHFWPTHNFGGTTQTLLAPPKLCWRFPKHAGGPQTAQKGHFGHPGAHIWRVKNHMCTKPGLNENTCFVYFVLSCRAKRVSAALTFSHKSLGFAGSPNFGHPTSNFDFLANFGHLLGLPKTALAHPTLDQLWIVWTNLGRPAQPHVAYSTCFRRVRQRCCFHDTLLAHAQLWWHHPNPAPEFPKHAGGFQTAQKVTFAPTSNFDF